MDIKHDDQASKLRKRILEPNEGAKEQLDLLKLPPRGEYHQHNSGKIKLKINYPVVKALLLLFIILIVSVVWYYYDPSPETNENNKKLPKENHEYIEEVRYEKPINNFKSTVGPKIQEEKQEESKIQPNPKETESTEKYKIIDHTVEKSDNLYRISIKYYGNDDGIGSIMNWNGLKSEAIQAGQVIQIPIPIKK